METAKGGMGAVRPEGGNSNECSATCILFGKLWGLLLLRGLCCCCCCCHVLLHTLLGRVVSCHASCTNTRTALCGLE